MEIKAREVPAAGRGFPDGSSRLLGRVYSGPRVMNPEKEAMMNEIPGLVEMHKRIVALEEAIREIQNPPKQRKWRWPWQRH